MNEARDGCRHSFWPIVSPMIADAGTTGEAALAVNKAVWSIKGFWDIHFKPNQTPEYMSPTEVPVPSFRGVNDSRIGVS